MKLVFKKKLREGSMDYEPFFYESQFVDPLNASMPYQIRISKFRRDYFVGGKPYHEGGRDYLAGQYQVTAKYMWEPLPKNKEGMELHHDYLGTFKYLADAKAAAQQHIDELGQI